MQKPVTRADLRGWLIGLAAALKKDSIKTNVNELVRELVEVQGCETGEDYIELDDAALANVQGATKRALLKYMKPRKTETVDVQGSVNPGSPTASGATTTLGSPGGTMSEGAEKAIIKIAAGSMKVPKLKGKATDAGISQLHEWIDDIVEQKQRDLTDAGILSALTMIKDSAGKPFSSVAAKLTKMQIDAAVDTEAKTEFKKIMPDRLEEKVKDKSIRAGTRYILELQEALIQRTWDELRGDLNTAMQDHPVATGPEDIRAKFEKWEKAIAEVRYTKFVDLETLTEALMVLLRKFQPTVLKVYSMWDKSAKDQAVLNDIITEVKTRIPKLETRKKHSSMDTKEEEDEIDDFKIKSSKDKKKKDKKEKYKNPSQEDIQRWGNMKCFDYQKGNCTRGDKCYFSHDMDNFSSSSSARNAVQRMQGEEEEPPERPLNGEELALFRQWMKGIKSEAIDSMNGQLRKASVKKHKPLQATRRRKEPAPRAPSYQMKIKSEVKDRLNNEGYTGPRNGPLLDSGSDTPVFSHKDKRHVNEVWKQHTVMDQMEGTMTAEQMGSTKIAGFEIKEGIIGSSAVKESTVPTHSVCQQGFIYVQSAAGATLHPEEDLSKALQCPVQPTTKGKLYRLPVTKDVVTAGKAAHLAAVEHNKTLRQNENRVQLEHQMNVHQPAMPAGMCRDHVCDSAKMKKDHQKQQHEEIVKPGEVDTSWDLIHSPIKDLDGNVAAVVCTTGEGLKIPVRVKGKDATTLKQAVIKIVNKIKRIYPSGTVIARFHADKEKGMETVVQQYIEAEGITPTETEGYDHNGNSRAERTNEKAREFQRSLLLDAAGDVHSYQDLALLAVEHGLDVCNYLPEAGQKSPMEKATGQAYDIHDNTYPFGCKVLFWEAPERRTGKEDLPTKTGVYLGRSDQVLGGHKVCTAVWNDLDGVWEMSKTLHRKTVRAFPEVMLLKTKSAAKKITARQSEAVLDKINGNTKKRAVYVLNKIHSKRMVNGNTEYQCTWKGYPNSHKTWEPLQNFAGLGGQQMVDKFEANLKTSGTVRFATATVTEDEKAVQHLMKKHRLAGTVQQHLESYQTERESVISKKLGEKLTASQVKLLKKEKVPIVMMRMNPEWHKPNHDFPEGRAKMRWLVRGDRQPAGWYKGYTDAPTLLKSTIRMLIAMGTLNGDPEDDEISTGDIYKAYLQGYDTAPEEEPKYVGYKAYPDAEMEVRPYKGPVYGDEGGGANMHITFHDWITGEMKYDRMTDEQIKSVFGAELMQFVRSENEIAMYRDQKTGLVAAKWVDDILVRGMKSCSTEFWSNCEKRFQLRSWGFVEEQSPRVYCGFNIEMSRQDGVKWYSMDMAEDLKEYLESINMFAVRPVTTPMYDRKELHSDEIPLTEEQKTEYQSKQGNLAYYADAYRYDISCETSLTAQFSQNPTRGAMKAVNRILAYLATTWDKKLKVPRVKGTVWSNYCDSDHAGARKYGDTLSRSAGIMLANGMPWHWFSKKQPVTAKSSAAAEIVALSDLIQDLQLRMWIAEEAGQDVNWPQIIKVDNQACVNFQNSMSPTSKLKGVFDLREQWLKELHDKSRFVAVKVDTEKNISDMLTKPLVAATRSRLEKEISSMADEIAQAFRGGR